ncbi:CIC11C00000002448 [Sungouiella intermedia]|uniref:Pre-mRNA-splicing factor SYF1 n=1 Tax=Sungouiella intermedia TaxID=45354 RepID=A0A1L0CXC3_9ASCO|nr:CIC11C00000002448 [[Candida] intermedia]
MPSVESLVAPEHLHYEQALLQDPDNESVWLDYVELVYGDMQKARFVLDRAVSKLPASSLLWNAYFLLPWTSKDLNVQLSIYQKALVVMGASPAIWMRYLALLKTCGDYKLLKRELDSALFRLDPQYHGPVWKIYLDLADKVEGHLGAQIYYRYIDSENLNDGPNICVDEIALKIAEFGNSTLATKVVSTLWTTSKPLSRMLSLVISDFCDILTQSLFDDDEHFEQICTDAIGMFPDLETEIQLKLAQYYVSRDNRNQAFHFFVCGIRASKSTKDVTTAFDKFTEYLERSSSDLPDHQLYLYEKLLDDRPLYINDIKLKQEINLVDNWLERINLLLEMGRKEEMLSTYVGAIRSINPLKSVSSVNNTVATIWIQYADVYVAQGDYDTANIIFSRAIKSQFKTIDELVDIHIAWAELMLERSDEDALNHVMDLLKTEESSDTSENALIQSPKLWEFRLDLLKAISNGEHSLDNPQTVLAEMLTSKVITLKILLDYAEYLASERLWDRYFAALDMGLGAFILSEARYEIWHIYIPKLEQLHSDKLDTLRQAYEKCTEQVPPFKCMEFYTKYAQFEKKNGLINKAVRILKQSITKLTTAYDDEWKSYSRPELNQIADDKYEIYVMIVEMISQYLKDVEMAREEFVIAVEDQHLTTPNTLDLCLRFIKFETYNKEFTRARALFKYAGGLGNPQHHMMKNIWKAWEEFELENGTEVAYKQMLKFKREVAKDYKKMEEAKSSINPMGFTKGSIAVDKTTSANPDAIELDMDM